MSYTILSGVIERVDAFKLLDVTVSSDVSWEAHVNTICARVDSTALLPETVETYRVACGWVTIFLFDGNKTCLRVWKCRVAPWPDCCTVTKPGVFAEEGPENHLPNYMWYAVWVHVCICWCTAPLCSEIYIGEEVLSLHHTIRQLFTRPSPPMAWFRNSFPASATLCLPNITN